MYGSESKKRSESDPSSDSPKGHVIGSVGTLKQSLKESGLAVAQRWDARKFTYGIIFTVGLSAFMAGYSMSAMNSCIANIAIDFEWCGDLSKEHLATFPRRLVVQCATSKWYQNWVNAVLFLGAAFGNGLGGWLSKFGRRRLLMGTDILFIVSSVLTATARGVNMLVASRFITGVGTGAMMCVGPMYLSEMVSKKERGKCCSLNELAFAFGILASVTLGAPAELPDLNDWTMAVPEVFDANWWRVVQAFMALIAGLQLLLFHTICNTESPMFLVSQKKPVEAREVLTSMGRPLKDLDQEMKELQEAEKQDQKSKGILEALQSKKYRHGIFIGGMLSVMQQLSGIAILNSSSTELFMKAGLTKEWVSRASTVMVVLQVPMVFVASRLVDSSGRRYLLQIGFLGMAASMSCGFVGSFFHDEIFGPLACLAIFGYVVFFFFSMGPVWWVYLAEIYPMEVRGSGMGCACACNSLMSFIILAVVKFMPLQMVFGTLLATNLLGRVFTDHCIVETKGSCIENCPLYAGIEDEDKPRQSSC